jgi:alkylhydroperoxidase family enzyme
MTTTLAAGLKPASVNFETLHKNYHPVLALVKELIGVVPACDPILEIWPTGFRTYNILVPNMFNLPNTIFGKKSFKASMGLAMYTSSRAAECPYCSAHTCSFALRRGATPEAISGQRTPKEKAVVAMAEALSRVPVELTMAHCNSMAEYFSPAEVEQIVYSISMMGFLNKFMDAVGVELEQEAINDTADLISKTGWKAGKHVNGAYKITEKSTLKSDSLLTYLRVIRQAPGAIRLEKKWTTGVPDSYSQAMEYLQEKTGHSFPVLKNIVQPRVILALTTVLRDNLNAETTEVGLATKCLAGYVFSGVVKNDKLSAEVRSMSMNFAPKPAEGIFEALEQLARNQTPTDVKSCKDVMTALQKHAGISEKDAAVILLARAAAPSPAEVNEAVIETTTPHISPAGVVEIIVWLSVLQLLHRLGSYYALVKPQA